MTNKPKTIRALDRGLMVIEHLSRTGRTSLARLRAETDLSNATLLRILATMQERNWVRKSMVDAKYELSHAIGSFLRTSKHSHPVAEIATPIMLALRDSELDYPSDLAVPVASGIIEVIETTRQRGPHAIIHPAYGVRPSLVFSGHGRTTLAFCEPSERKNHIAAIKASGTREENLWVENGRLDNVIRETRERGFGIREFDYWIGDFEDGPELGAFAYPIFSKDRLCATLTLLWLGKDKSLEDMLEQSSSNLVQKSADKIGAALRAINYKPEPMN